MGRVREASGRGDFCRCCALPGQGLPSNTFPLRQLEDAVC